MDDLRQRAYRTGRERRSGGRHGRAQPGVREDVIESNIIGGEHMTRTHVVEEKSANPAKCRAVHRRSRTSQERPFLSPIVRDGRVRVVQEGDHHCAISAQGVALRA